MTSPDSRVRIWLGIFRRHQVVLSSPHPVSECLRRLAEVTALHDATAWYLDPQTVGRPEPRFRGQVELSRIQLARFNAGSGRDSFFAVLNARPRREADGGTTFSGRVGEGAGVAFLEPALTAAAGLVSVGLLVAGVIQLVLGHLIGLAPAVAFWLPIAGMAGLNVAAHLSLQRDIPELLQMVNEVLDSTTVFLCPSAVSTDRISHA